MAAIPFTTAAPSWVMAGTIYDNCVFLENKVDEVGLLFFETESCLAYSNNDLPTELATLDLNYHVHLPLDLPWSDPAQVAEIILRLMEKVQFLGVERAVLHPPVTQGDDGFSRAEALSALDTVAAAWERAGLRCNDLLIENIDGAELTDLVPAFNRWEFGLCLDLGHVIAYGQEPLLDCREICNRLRMVHLNAPADCFSVAGKSRHVSLDRLDKDGRRIARRMLALCSKDTVLMYELFKWEHILSTIPVVKELLLSEE